MIKSKRSLTDTRIKIVCERLREMAYARGPAAKLPTVDEMCVSFETSRTTLNDALRELEARKIIYRRQGSGVYVSPKIGCKRIHIILDSNHFQVAGASPFWGMIAGLLINEAQNRALVLNEEHRFHMITSLSGDTSHYEQIIQDMASTGIASALLIGSDESINRWLDENEIPYVSYAAKGRYIIRHDDAGFIGALETLAERGCRRIGVWIHADAISPARSRREIDARMAPYIGALKRLGLVDNPDWMVDLWWHELGESYRALPTVQQQGYNLARDLYGPADGIKPDGLVILNDMMTSGALVALNELGIEAGRDVQIATHANAGSPILFGQDKHLILVEIDPGEIVNAAFQLLDVLMAGEKPVNEAVWLPHRIRIPESGSARQEESTGHK